MHSTNKETLTTTEVEKETSINKQNREEGNLQQQEQQQNEEVVDNNDSNGIIDFDNTQKRQRRYNDGTITKTTTTTANGITTEIQKAIEEKQRKNTYDGIAKTVNGTREIKKNQLEMLLARSKAFEHLLAAETDDEEEDDEEEDDEQLSIEAPPVQSKRRRDVRISKQPSILASHCMMHTYQLEGLNWLNKLYCNHINGILADEMGLGKTLQIISFIAYLREFHNVIGPHIIILPKNVIGKWIRQFRKWCPCISVLRMASSITSEEECHRFIIQHLVLDPMRNKYDFDVLITSYDGLLLLYEHIRFQKIIWNCLIISKGHGIKCNENLNLRSKAISSMDSTFRLLLFDESPLQNNLRKLRSLLIFLFPDSFCDMEQYVDKSFGDESCGKENMIKKLRTIIQPFMLHRMKHNVKQYWAKEQSTVVKNEQQRLKVTSRGTTTTTATKKFALQGTGTMTTTGSSGTCRQDESEKIGDDEDDDGEEEVELVKVVVAIGNNNKSTQVVKNELKIRQVKNEVIEIDFEDSEKDHSSILQDCCEKNPNNQNINADRNSIQNQNQIQKNMNNNSMNSLSLSLRLGANTDISTNGYIIDRANAKHRDNDITEEATDFELQTTSEKDKSFKINDLVYAEWYMDKCYYWGHIETKEKQQHSATYNYSIKFLDGDFSPSVSSNDMHSFLEYCKLRDKKKIVPNDPPSKQVSMQMKRIEENKKRGGGQLKVSLVRKKKKRKIAKKNTSLFDQREFDHDRQSENPPIDADARIPADQGENISSDKFFDDEDGLFDDDDKRSVDADAKQQPAEQDGNDSVDTFIDEDGLFDDDDKQSVDADAKQQPAEQDGNDSVDCFDDEDGLFDEDEQCADENAKPAEQDEQDSANQFDDDDGLFEDDEKSADIDSKHSAEQDDKDCAGLPPNQFDDDDGLFESDASNEPSVNEKIQRDLNVDEDCLDSSEWMYPPINPTIKKSPSQKRKSQALPPTAEHGIQQVTKINDYTFLRWKFRSENLLQTQTNLSAKGKEGITDTQIYNGRKYSLVAMKTDKNTLSSGVHQRQVCKAFYLKVSKKISLQDELNKIADFESLPRRKIASRLELFVSPACKFGSEKTPLWIQFQTEEFEVIDENSNIGCGFAPEKFFEDCFGDSQAYKSKVAVQIRMFCPNLGIFKGILMKKDGISKIQLAESMRKVGPSKHKEHSFDGAFMIIKQIFPTHDCEMFHRYLHPQLSPTPSSERNLRKKGFPEDIARLWRGMGVDEQLIADYIDSSYTWDGRKHIASCLGVADPTGTLPEGTIFVTGMGVREKGPVQKVFLTRFPCTEVIDGKVIKRVTTKPEKMRQEDWNLLCSYHFGIIIFATPTSGAKPLPEQLANGDLDGDNYFLCWDAQIIQSIESNAAADQNIDPDYEDPLLITKVIWLKNESGKHEKAIVQGKDWDNKYIVKYDNGDEIRKTKEALQTGKDFVKSIENHRGKGMKTLEVNILWNNGDITWEKWSENKIDFNEHLYDYAMRKKLLDTTGWKWIKAFNHNKDVIEVFGHKQCRGNKPSALHVRWSTGKIGWAPVKDLKRKHNDALDDDDVVINYAEETGIIQWDEFEWARNYTMQVKTHWLSYTQKLLCNLQHWNDLCCLRTELHRMFAYACDEKGMKDHDVVMIGRAYKVSNDIAKHGGKVTLPEHLKKGKITKRLQKYVNSYFEFT